MLQETTRYTDTPPQAINHIDHVGIIVRYENVDKYVKLLSNVLGITFEAPIVNEPLGLTAVLSWPSGFEIMAPMREEGPYWDRIQKFGEGTCTIIFGVPDIDAAVQRAKENGVDVAFRSELKGDEPWLQRFSAFEEARLNLFGPEFAATVSLSEIVPA